MTVAHPNVFIDHIDICHLPFHVICSWIGSSNGLDNGSSSDPPHRREGQHGGEEEVRAGRDADYFVGVGLAAFEEGVGRPA